MSSRKITSLLLDRTPLEKPSESDPQTPPLDDILFKSLVRLKSWKPPPNWSAAGWFDELQQLAHIAAWEGLCDYKVGATTSIEAFIYLRIIERVLTCYRREWSYAMRFALEPLDEPESGHPLPEGEGGGEGEGRTGKSVARTLAVAYSYDEQYAAQEHERIREAVASLSTPQRFLIEEIFWNGRTEEELGLMLHVSQKMVSKRKQAALQLLRDHIAVQSQAAR